MKNNLMIVESPNKIKKITAFLGQGWKVAASVGHISDMAIRKGIDGLGLEDTTEFKVIYEVAKEKKDVVKNLKDLVKASDQVYLAMDPDREGEAIASQLKLFLKLKNYKRISFNEISKKAVLASFEKEGLIDQSLVNSQETRRIIDRVYGFKGSQAARKYDPKIRSVGRVQSAGLLLVVQREEEIEAFVPIKYIDPILTIENLEFTLKTNKNFTKEQAMEMDWKNFDFPEKTYVELLDLTTKKVSPPKPLSTNLALKLGSRLGYRPKETTRLLQQLFEKGLITYIRTDSINLSKDFKDEAQTYIKTKYGYKTDISRNFKLGDLAQEGHEAIRPVHIEDEGNNINDSRGKKLYEAIRKITIASLLEDGEDLVQNIETKIEEYTFGNSSKAIKKEGFRTFWGYEKDKYSLNSLESGTYSMKVELKEKITQAPPRYSEATFLSTIEKEGIGRPSTYSSMLQVIQDRDYVIVEKKHLIPTKEGRKAIAFLREFYPTFIDLGYTRDMEAKLDLIAQDKESKVETLNPFWDEVMKLTKEALGKIKNMNMQDPGELIKENGICPKCKSPLFKRKSKFGDFIGCSDYPNCKYIKPKENSQSDPDEPKVKKGTCPKCGEDLIEKKGKYGVFLGCSSYPKCKYIKPYEKSKQEADKPKIKKGICPKCSGDLVEKKGKYGKFISCNNYPKCKYIKK